MPAIIVGADTPTGAAIVDRLVTKGGEVRAFVSDPSVIDELKAKKVKVAVGDVSDASHVGGAALECFTAVFIETAAVDERERSFAPDPPSVVAAWAEAAIDGGVRRVLWVGESPMSEALAGAAPETAHVPLDSDPDRTADEVARLDDLASL